MAVSRSRATALILSLLFVVLGAFGWGVLRKIQLDNSSSELAVALLRDTLSSGSATALINYAHPEWLQLMPTDSISSYLENSVRRLGSLQSMSTITGESDTPLIPLPGSPIPATYAIELEMGSTPVSAELDMRYEDGQWWLLNLVLNTPRLMD